MASTCPKCHQTVATDLVCCADIKYTWKCKACGKLSTGFVVPYGRCFLCGGENEVVRGQDGGSPERAAIVREALQFELDTFHYYRLAAQRTEDPQMRELCEEMASKEEDHLAELEDKYHVHLDPSLKSLAPSADALLAKWLFADLESLPPGHEVLSLYDKALAMERRTRDHFRARAQALPPGPEKEIYRELAAEEEEHVSVLETEREHFTR